MGLVRHAFALPLLLAVGCSFPEYTTREDAPRLIESCHDGLLSVDETDVDCGPSCSATCANGQSCSADGECQTGFCNFGRCAQPSCQDEAKNRSETDVDCGGSDGCKACTVGQRCMTAYDCDGGSCISGRCQAPNCGDGLQNQDETDVDCGGTTGCDPCATKQHCIRDADCEKSLCSQGRCQPGSCTDGVQNGDETDVDCGGSCPSCADFERCQRSADCRSLVCSAAGQPICLAATCSDGVKNGTEPTLDCGRDCPNHCPLISACSQNADCASGRCANGRCTPEKATGAALTTTGWFATASATFGQDTLPGNALDGRADTLWISGTPQAAGMWFLVDMLQPRAFFGVELVCTSDSDYPRSLRLLLSEDGQTFVAATPTLMGAKTLRFDFPDAKIARFLKLELEQQTYLWWRIDELHVLQ